MAIRNKQLIDLLSQYPDESIVTIFDNDCDNSERNITSVIIDYSCTDDYVEPFITLK